jgi:trigger factor
VDVGDYRAVRVPFEPEPVTEEQIEEYLTETQQEHAQWVPADRPAALGDQVVIDAEGKIGAEADTVLSNEDHEMLLEADASHPLPGFHEEIVGMSAGEDKTFELTYPDDDFEDDVAGKEATFTVHLHSVKEEEVPQLDDDLAMMVGDYDTLDDLRASVRETLEAEALEEAESQYLDGVLEAIIETAVKIEYPPQAIDREADVALEQMERNLASSGLQLDTYLNMLGKTREAYRSELRPAAEERLKKRLVMVEVSKQERLELEDEEIEAQINRVSESMGENADQMREFLETTQGRLSVADDLMSTKVQERIVEIGKGEAPPLEAEDEVEPEAETDAADETPTEEAGAGAESDAADETPAEEAGAEAETDIADETPEEEAGAEAESDAADETPVEEPESEATEETAGQESEAEEAQSSEPEVPTDDAAESDEETIEEAESNDSD